MTVDFEGELTFEAAEEKAKIPPVDPATYEFVVDRVDDGNTMEERPRWAVYLKIVNNPKYVNRSLIYNAVLPWINPQTGLWDISGIGLLTNLCQGTGSAWSGDLRKVEIQEVLKQALQSKSGFMRVGLRPYVDPNTEEKVVGNKVQIVVAKRRR